METKQLKVQTKQKQPHYLPNKTWYLIDAKDKILGRLSSQVAKILMGKHKPTWQPHIDMGDNVIIINAAKVAVTGRKEEQKLYYRYSGYPGGLKTENLATLRQRKPEAIIYHAIKGMLPKNRLGAAMLKKLYVYPGEDHPHDAQKPQELEV